MNQRERFVACMRHQPVDRIPLMSWDTYLYYVERRRELLGGPPGRSW